MGVAARRTERATERERAAAPPVAALPATPPVSPGCTDPPAPLGDPRFRALLGAKAWRALPPAVRRRFSHRLADGATAIYRGRTVRLERGVAGAILAHALRPLGAPLPLRAETGTASVISVTEEGCGEDGGGGQVWSRLYAARRGFPQTIHSAKRFGGPTGLEEHVGRGVSMALRVGVEDGALVFRSAGYAVTVLGRRLALPGWLTPGALTVRHEDRGGGAFAFSLTLRHPWLGLLLHQEGIYRDAPA